MRTDIVVGGQYGSEAKGHIAAILCEPNEPGYCIRVGGPNAGHSVVDAKGQKFAFRTIPVGAVNSGKLLYIGPGSEIDIEVLREEWDVCKQAGYDLTGRLFISPEATIITDEHKQREASLNESIGSTAKGVGAARASRLMREADTAGMSYRKKEFEDIGVTDLYPGSLQRSWRTGHHVIEGTQGYGLGLHAGSYPFCTAGDCRNVDFLAQSGIPMGVGTVDTWVVFRTFPIRVAGNSGPMLKETTWMALGEATGGYIQPEQTTVTKKTRRVGAWDPILAYAALRANGYLGTEEPNRVHPVLTFVDYLDPKLAGATSMADLYASPAWGWIENVEYDLDCRFDLFTTGPATRIWRS